MSMSLVLLSPPFWNHAFENPIHIRVLFPVEMDQTKRVKDYATNKYQNYLFSVKLNRHLYHNVGTKVYNSLEIFLIGSKPYINSTRNWRVVSHFLWQKILLRVKIFPYYVNLINIIHVYHCIYFSKIYMRVEKIPYTFTI